MIFYFSGTLTPPRPARNKLALVGLGPTPGSPGPAEVLGRLNPILPGLVGAPLEIEGLRDFARVSLVVETAEPKGTNAEGPGARSMDERFVLGV